MYRFSTNVKKIIHNDKLVLINLNTGQWIRMSMTVYKRNAEIKKWLYLK